MPGPREIRALLFSCAGVHNGHRVEWVVSVQGLPAGACG